MILLPIILFAAWQVAQAQNQFARFAELHGVRYGQAAWGDFDNDGDLDLVLVGKDTNDVAIGKIYRNTGNGFVDINAGIQGVVNGAVAWGDYDNDNDLDLLVTGYADQVREITWLYRNDDGQFVWEQNAVFEGGFYSWVAWGDYDNDGDQDVLARGHHNGVGTFTWIYENTGGGQFVKRVDIELDAERYSGEWGDYNNDGFLDFILMGQKNISEAIDWVRLDPEEFLHDSTAWVVSIDGVTSVGEGGSGQIPTAFALEQNHPNPFNPSTRIRYALPVAGQVKLTVFDLTGRIVATLVDGHKAAAYHEIVFDASHLPSGVYYYRLDAAGFRETKKMLFVK